MRKWLRYVDRAVEPACLLFAAAWTLWFFWLQTTHLLDPYFLEWDARACTLAAWRYHGTGLFPNDLMVDFAAVYYPPAVKLVYFIATFFANPHWVSKLVPFALAPVVVWQSYCLGRALGGRILGAAAVILILHCHFVWGRIVGVNARAFGFPLVLTFLRYAVEKRERPALAALLAATLFYPSSFLVCAPAYGVTLLWPLRPDARWLRYGVTVAVGIVILALTSLRADPRIGHPISMKELDTLEQRGIVGTSPLPPALDVMKQVVRTSLYDDYGRVRWLRHAKAREEGTVVLVLAIVFAVVAGTRLRRLPPIFLGLLGGSLLAFWVAQTFPYRLYIPDRILLYAWPPLLLFGLLYVGALAFSRLTAQQRYASLMAAVAVVGVELAFYGDGMTREINIHNWHGRAEDATVRFAATLPKDVTLAAPFDKSSSIEAFARRQVLFSSILNTPIYYPIGLELERRIRDFYLAYYARDWAAVKRLRDVDHVDYLVVDARDFGPDARRRAEYLNWTALARAQIAAGPVDQLLWAHPPADAIAFHDGNDSVVDLRKLAL